jgi:hypothetical protein
MIDRCTLNRTHDTIELWDEYSNILLTLKTYAKLRKHRKV